MCSYLFPRLFCASGQYRACNSRDLVPDRAGTSYYRFANEVWDKSAGIRFLDQPKKKICEDALT